MICRPTTRSFAAPLPKLDSCAATRSSRRRASDSQVAAPITSWQGFARPSWRTAAASPPQIELGAGEAEVLPAAAGQLGRVAVGRAVPALHRQDAEAVARAQAVGLERAGEGGVGRRRERVVEGERDAARLEVPAEGLGGAEGRDAHPAWISHVFDLPCLSSRGTPTCRPLSSRGTPSGRVPRDLPVADPSSPGTTGLLGVTRKKTAGAGEGSRPGRERSARRSRGRRAGCCAAVPSRR